MELLHSFSIYNYRKICDSSLFPHIYNITPMTLAGMGVTYKRLRNEEQGELGLSTFQQTGVAFALVAAITDILLIDISVASL